MILTSNRGLAEWGEVFGDPVVATALLDWLLHHSIVNQLENSSYRLRQHIPLHIDFRRVQKTSTIPATSRFIRGISGLKQVEVQLATNRVRDNRDGKRSSNLSASLQCSTKLDSQ